VRIVEAFAREENIMTSFRRFRPFATLTLACALLVFSVGPAYGSCCGKHKHGHCPAYSDIDTDENGAVTSEEFYAFRAARMSERAKEGRKMKHAGNAPSFEDLDLDGDGNLSAEEFAEHHSKCPAAKPD
jgi:hypothetical protein